MSVLSSIRAGLNPPAGVGVQTQGSALTGQAAFFRAAMGVKAEPAMTAEVVSVPKAHTSKPQVRLAEGEMPSGLLRPGSLLDIRV